MVAQRRDQPQLIQRRRAQLIDQAADVGQGFLGLAFVALQQLVCRIGVAVQQVARCVDLHGERGQLWPQPVVQVAAQPAALLFARSDQPHS